MPRFKKARKNMVQCQINTNGVIAPAVLEVFDTIPREAFLPPYMSDVAYIDEDISFDGGFLMEPLVHARMVQALAPKQSDSALVIGDGSGYAAAILSPLVSTVMALEEQPGALDQARAIWEKLEYCNVATVQGCAAQGCPEHAPYDLIFVNGAVSCLPESLLSQLAPGGRMVCVVKEDGKPMGAIILSSKQENGVIATRNLFDAATVYVPGFEPKQAFVF